MAKTKAQIQSEYAKRTGYEAQKKYDEKFDRISAKIPKGTKETIILLDPKGSVNNFINNAIDFYIDYLESK